MANYFATLPSYNTGPGIDFSPINNALDSITAQNNANRSYGLQKNHLELQKNRDARADQELQYQHGRNDKQDKLQQVQMFGKQAGAVDQMEGPQRAAAWQSVIARHGADGLTPEELDPITGPKLLMAQAGQFIDPLDRQEKQLGIQKTQAEINKLNAEAANGGEAYGKTGAIFLNPETNRYEAVQFGGRGQVKRTELGGLTPSKGVGVEGDLMYDKATGADVRRVGSNIAEGERQKVIGRETGEGQMKLPKQESALKMQETQDKFVSGAVDKAISQADGWTTGLAGSAAQTIPGSAAHNLRATLMGIQSNLGFDKLQDMRNNSPTGGALGNVSEMEIRLLQSAWGNIEQSQSKEQLVESLKSVKKIRDEFSAMRRQAYEADVARFGKERVPDPESGKLLGTAQPESAPSSDVDPATIPAGQTFSYRGHTLKALGNGQFEKVQ